MGGRWEALGRMIPVLLICVTIIPLPFCVFCTPFVTFLTFENLFALARCEIYKDNRDNISSLP